MIDFARRMKILAPIHFRISVQSNDDIVAVLTHLGRFNNENQLMDGWERTMKTVFIGKR